MARTYQRYSDDLLAEYLAVGKTVAAAARAAGISERSAYRRKKQPAVRDRIDEVRRAALDTASARLDHGMLSACDTLIGLFGHANPHVQIRAAQTVIQLALKVRREAEVADQLGPIAELPRPSRGVPVVPDTEEPSVGLDPDRLRPPDLPSPDGVAGSPTGPAPCHAGIELATGEDDWSGGAGLDPPPSPAHAGGTPELDRRPRPDRTAQVVAVVAVLLLLLAGLPCGLAGATRARVEGGPAADGTLPTCQNLTEPATGAVAARCPMRDQTPARAPVSSRPSSLPFPVEEWLRGGRRRAPDQLAELGAVPDRGQVRVPGGAGG